MCPLRIIANFKDYFLLFHSHIISSLMDEYASPFHLIRYSAPSFYSFLYIILSSGLAFSPSTQNHSPAFPQVKIQQPSSQHCLSIATTPCSPLPVVTFWDSSPATILHLQHICHQLHFILPNYVRATLLSLRHPRIQLGIFITYPSWYLFFI